MRNKRLIIIFSILLSLTLFIAIGSAIFSIRRVDAYCYNSDDEAILNEIVNGEGDNKSIKKLLVGKSIFALNEKKLIAEVESRVAGIKVINIERLFPNRVSINFIKLYQYFQVSYGESCYTFGKDGKVIGEAERSSGLIEVKCNLAEAPKPNEPLDFDFADELFTIADTLERLDYAGSDATVIVEFIDFTAKDKVFIGMRSGVCLELMGMTSLEDKLRMALSLYVHNEDYRLIGTIISDTDADGNLIAFHSPQDRYEKRNEEESDQ